MYEKFLIEKVFKITGIGTVVVGRVTDGQIRIGNKLNLEGNEMEIKLIEVEHKNVEFASRGQEKVSIALKNDNYDLLKNKEGTEIKFE